MDFHVKITSSGAFGMEVEFTFGLGTGYTDSTF